MQSYFRSLDPSCFRLHTRNSALKHYLYLQDTKIPVGAPKRPRKMHHAGHCTIAALFKHCPAPVSSCPALSMTCWTIQQA